MAERYEPGRRPSGRLRFLLVIGGTGLTWAGSAALFGTVAVQAWEGVTATGPVRAEDVVALVAAVAGSALVLWWASAAALCVAAQALPTSTHHARRLRRSAHAITPALVRRAVSAALGVSVLGASGLVVAAPAVGSAVGSAAQHAPPATSAASLATGTPAPDLDPGWGPAPQRRSRVRPTGTTSAPGTGTDPGSPALVVVRPGDTLWDLAADDLGDGATHADVAAHWPRWHAVNRDVVGSDPDHLRPGQRLRVPSQERS
jgi:nucleoid-associated protein YgaU